ncbi:MAG: hypothetical protein ACFFCZ_22230 [Promethearchaeota archaeon]
MQKRWVFFWLFILICSSLFLLESSDFSLTDNTTSTPIKASENTSSFEDTLFISMINSTSGTSGQAITIDDNNNVYGLGTRYYSTMSEDWDFLLVKWDVKGKLLWNHTFQEPDHKNSGEGITLGENNTIITVGSTLYDSSKFCPLIVKWDPDGNVLWSTTLKTYTMAARGVDIDVSGNIYVVGDIKVSGTDEEHRDLIILKLDNTGEVLWSKTWEGSSKDDFGMDISTDNQSNVYALGEYDGGMGLSKWDSEGNFIWGKIWRGENSALGSALVLGNDGFIYTTGGYDPPGVNPPTLLLVKWDSSGNVLWYRTNSDVFWGAAISVKANDTIYTVGYTYSATNFTKLIPLAGKVVLEKWDSSGNHIGVQTWLLAPKGGDGATLSGVAVGNNNKIYCVGTFYNSSDDTLRQWESLILVIFSDENFRSVEINQVVIGVPFEVSVMLFPLLVFFFRRKVNKKNTRILLFKNNDQK